MYSILHLSDLHRSPVDPISNAELISALVADRERYRQETPPIRVPDAIIVSGDIIQGVGLGEVDSATKLADQYAIAEEFLSRITERFLAGDRSHVILVPGNHDVDWNTARRAMEAVPGSSLPPGFPGCLLKEDTPFRWDWKALQLYRIADEALYTNRMAAFWRFFERFYSGTPGLLRVAAFQPVQLFRLAEGRIAVAAFDSCHGNDCFAFHGSIPREVVAQASLDLADASLFELSIAVWHHSFEGPPYHTDYMDVDIIRGMIGRGFRLGLYGHHHKAQALPHQLLLPDSETMALVSAGSLCAGRSELPTGVHRQYNVIELEDNLLSARVHVRSMFAANLFGRAALDELGGLGHFTLSWGPPKDLVGRTADVREMRLRALVLKAEAALKAGDTGECVALLASHVDSLDPHGRRLLFEGASQRGDWDLVLRLTAVPQSILELLLQVRAALELRDPTGARHTLDRFASPLNVDAATVRELRTRIAAAEAMLQ